MLLFSLLAFTWEDLTGALTGDPDALAGFDVAGDPVSVDPVPLVEGICDPLIDEAVDEVLAAIDDEIELLVPGLCDAEIASVVPGLIAAALAAAAPPHLTFDGSERVAWLQSGASATGTGATSGGKIYFNPHLEEVGRVYDSVELNVSGVTLNQTVMGVYEVSRATGKPDALIWTAGAAQSGTPAGVKAFPFASGTFTTYGAAYDDGSGHLALPLGAAVAIAEQHSGNMSMRTFTTASCRQLGVDTAGGAPFTGWELPVTFGAWPNPAGAVGSRSSGSIGAYSLHVL